VVLAEALVGYSRPGFRVELIWLLMQGNESRQMQGSISRGSFCWSTSWQYHRCATGSKATEFTLLIILLDFAEIGYHLSLFLSEKDFLCQVVTKGRLFKQYMENEVWISSRIIEALVGQDADGRIRALKHLFERPQLRKAAIAYVCKHSGNQQDGEDVFQEAIIVFDRRIRQGAYNGQGSLEAYFMGIVRWYWFNERQRHRDVLLGASGPEPPPEGDPELEYLITEQCEQLEQLLAQLTDKCRNLLKMYQLNYSMNEIAQAMGYANSGVAKKEAFLCRKRFQALLKTRPEIWSDLILKKEL